MNFWIAMGVGFKEIWAYKFRSLLTMLGIVLGVSSLVAMSALVQGMEKGAKESLIAIGGLQKIRIDAQDRADRTAPPRDQAIGMTINMCMPSRQALPWSKPFPRRCAFSGHADRQRQEVSPVESRRVWPVAARLSEHVIEHGRMFNAN